MDGNERGIADQSSDVLRVLYVPSILGIEAVHGHFDVLHHASGSRQHVQALVEDEPKNLPRNKLVPIISGHREIFVPVIVNAGESFLAMIGFDSAFLSFMAAFL